MLSFHRSGRWVLLVVMGIGVQQLPAAGRHANPLDAISGRPSKSPVRKRPRTDEPAARPARHYSPLDAMQGRFIERKKKSVSSRKHTNPTSTRSSSPSKKTDPAVMPAVGSDDATAPSDVEVVPLEGTPVEETMVLPESVPAASPKAAAGVPSVASEAQQRPAAPRSADGEKGRRPSVPARQVKPTKKRTAAAPSPVSPLPLLHAPRTKVLFLTFDDGPVRGTANLLRILKEEGVKATLFSIGERVEKHPKLFHKALATPEVLVANHTYSHANNHYRRFYTGSVPNVVNDIDRAQKLIGGAKYLRLAGRDVWRLPKLKRNDWAISVAQRNKEIAKYDALANRGYFIYGWDIEWGFSHKTQKPLFGGAEMARRVETLYRSGKMAQKGKVVLLAHDYMWRTPSSARQLRLFVQIMKERGWRFETVDQYCSTTPEAYARTRIKKAPIVHPAQKLAQKATMLPPEKAPTIVPKPVKPLKKPSRIELVSQLNDAIGKQQFIRMRRLIAQGADINARDAKGRLPLNVAIQTNNAVLVRMLVERGANIFSVDAEGMSPMGVARQHKNTIIIRYLIRQINKQRQHRLRKTLFAIGSVPHAG